MNNARTFDLNTYLPYRLSILSNRISSTISQVYHEKYALSIPEWRIVAILGNYQTCTATEIVDYTAMDKVAISRGVKKLIKRGFIERSEDADDRRRQNLSLTKVGQEVYEEVIPLTIEFEHMYINELNSKDIADLDRIVSKLFAVMDK